MDGLGFAEIGNFDETFFGLGCESEMRARDIDVVERSENDAGRFAEIDATLRGRFVDSLAADFESGVE